MENNTKEVLTPSHRLWPTFRKKLDDAVTIYADGKLKNQCNGDLSLTTKILESMKNIDVKETIIFFKQHGGSCDCKVIMNVARIWNNR
ncbi:MAG: DUF2695 domain-containing protein [Desulfobacula sp.]|jgi:hypothetical protein|nr:DUF2695 domain-containing protein [Desulfobacula sp.]